MHFRKAYGTFLLIATGWLLSAQSFHFELFDTQDGLLSTQINVLHQDQKGYLWIGTEVGVCLYDGYTFDCYTPADGLSKGPVVAFAESSEGVVWIASEKGLAYFKSGKFEMIKVRQHSNGESISSIFLDRGENLWVGTNQGLGVLGKKDLGQARAMRDSSFFRFFPQSFDVSEITQDSSGTILVGSHNQLLRIRGSEMDTIGQSSGDIFDFFNKILPLADGQVLAGTNEGALFLFNKGVKQLLLPSNVPLLNVFEIIPHEQDFWVLHHNGFMILRPDKTFTDYSLFEKMNLKIMRCMAKDREGNFWVGSGEGLVRVTPRDFRLYPELDEKMPSGIFSINETPEGRLILGSNYTRIFTKGPEEPGFVKKIIPELAYAEIVGLVYDDNGALWVVTHWDGVFHIKGQTFDRYWYDEGVFEGADMHFAFRDNKGRIWLGHNFGLSNLSFKDDNRVVINNLSGTEYIKFLAYAGDPLGRIWFGGDGGLFAFEGDSIRKYSLPFEDLTVSGLSLESDGRLWVATQGKGVFRFRTERDSLILEKTFNTDNGLSTNFLLDVEKDWQGNIWMGSYLGISVLRKTANGYLLTNYMPEDGLIRKAYENIILYEDRQKVMWAVTTMGLMSFDGNEISLNKVEPLLHLTGLKIHGESVSMDIEEKLILPHTQNSLEFQVTAISLKNPQKIKYQYRLEGGTGEWTQPSVDREIAFNQLSSGNYTLWVKACNNDQIWNTIPLKIEFRIKPPFWFTWWFLAGLGALVAIVVYVIIKRRENRIKLVEAEKSRVNQLIAELETKALRAQMNPHFIFNSLNAIQECIMTEQIDTAYDYLFKFSRLLRKVLESSSKSLITIENELEVLRLYLALEGLRFDEKFVWKIEKGEDEEIEEMYIPSLMIQPFVENAIWHGLLHKKGNRQLKISFYLEEKLLVCIVEDNGIGRKQAKEIRKRKKFKHQSLALQLITDRLAIIEQQTNKMARIKIVDLFDEQGDARGTRVEIRLPNDLLPRTP